MCLIAMVTRSLKLDMMAIKSLKLYNMKKPLQHNRYLIYLSMINRYLCYPKSMTAKTYHRHNKDDLLEMAKDINQFEDAELVALTPARDVEIHDGMKYTNTRINGDEMRLSLVDIGTGRGHTLADPNSSF